MDEALGNSQTFATSVALRELLWGALSPFAGHAGQRYGFGRVLAVGVVLYASGVMVSSQSAGRPGLFLLCFIICGVGAGLCAIPVVLTATSGLLPARARPFVSSSITACASVGTAVLAPAFRHVLSKDGWRFGIFGLGAITLPLLPLIPVLRSRLDTLKPAAATALPKAGGAGGVAAGNVAAGGVAAGNVAAGGVAAGNVAAGGVAAGGAGTAAPSNPQSEREDGHASFVTVVLEGFMRCAPPARGMPAAPRHVTPLLRPRSYLPSPPGATTSASCSASSLADSTSPFWRLTCPHSSRREASPQENPQPRRTSPTHTWPVNALPSHSASRSRSRSRFQTRPARIPIPNPSSSHLDPDPQPSSRCPQAFRRPTARSRLR